MYWYAGKVKNSSKSFLNIIVLYKSKANKNFPSLNRSDPISSLIVLSDSSKILFNNSLVITVPLSKQHLCFISNHIGLFNFFEYMSLLLFELIGNKIA